MKNSHIEWTDHTFNPWIGCTMVDELCIHCYAYTRDQRFADGVHWGPGAPRQRTSPANWKQPIAWNRRIEGGGELRGYKVRERVFCASLADWLDDEVAIEWLVDLLDLIHRTPNLDWLLLTKRPQNWRSRIEAARSWADEHAAGTLPAWIDNWLHGSIYPNLWIGTSVGHQKSADKRIPELLQIPARVRFLSCEPLLGPVNLAKAGAIWSDMNDQPIDGRGLNQHIHWVIAGGESGHGARPMHPDWARSLRDQCAAAGVPFFFKQWGAWSPDTAPCVAPTHWLWRSGHMESYGAPNASSAVREGAVTVSRHGKLASGRILDGQEHNGRPTP